MKIEISDKELFDYHAEFNQLYGFLLGKFALSGRNSDDLDNQFPVFNKIRLNINEEMRRFEINKK